MNAKVNLSDFTGENEEGLTRDLGLILDTIDKKGGSLKIVNDKNPTYENMFIISSILYEIDDKMDKKYSIDGITETDDEYYMYESSEGYKAPYSRKAVIGALNDGYDVKVYISR